MQELLFFVRYLFSHFSKINSMHFMKYLIIMVTKNFNYHFIFKVKFYSNFKTDFNKTIQKYFYPCVYQYFSRLILADLIFCIYCLDFLAKSFS